MVQETRASGDAGPERTAPAILFACHWGGHEGADTFRDFGVVGCKTACARACIGQAPTIGFCSQDILIGHPLDLSRATGCLEAIPYIPPGALENFREHSHSCLLLHPRSQSTSEHLGR